MYIYFGNAFKKTKTITIFFKAWFKIRVLAVYMIFEMLIIIISSQYAYKKRTRQSKRYAENPRDMAVFLNTYTNTQIYE